MTTGSNSPPVAGTSEMPVQLDMRTSMQPIEVPGSTANTDPEPAPADRGAGSPHPARDVNHPTHTPSAPGTILVIDIGGTKVKMLATGQTEPVKFLSGPEFTPARLVETVQKLGKDWDYEAISIGYPGLVGSQGPRSEPGNLGSGWVGYDFAAGFGKPVKMINDAALQALGSYEGGRMLFLGLGTGLGSTLITGHMIIPLELGRMIYGGGRTMGEVLGRQGQRQAGMARWQRAVTKAVTAFMHSFLADYVVIGGGNAKHVEKLPPGVRRGNNLTAFRGGFRLWSVEDIWVQAVPGEDIPEPIPQEPLRML